MKKVFLLFTSVVCTSGIYTLTIYVTFSKIWIELCLRKALKPRCLLRPWLSKAFWWCRPMCPNWSWKLDKCHPKLWSDRLLPARHVLLSFWLLLHLLEKQGDMQKEQKVQTSWRFLCPLWGVLSSWNLLCWISLSRWTSIIIYYK